jgi:hypothetical protein
LRSRSAVATAQGNEAEIEEIGIRQRIAAQSGMTQN